MSFHLTSRSGIHIRLHVHAGGTHFATVQLRSILLLVVFRHGYGPCRFTLRERDAYAVRRPKIERLRRSSQNCLAYGLLRSLRAHRSRAHLQNNCIVQPIVRLRETHVVSTQSHQRPRPCIVDNCAWTRTSPPTPTMDTHAWGFLLGVLRRKP